MGFSSQVVEDILVKSGRYCCLCHKFKGHKIEVHHIQQRADRGNDDADNGIPLCFDCHAEVKAYDPHHPKGRRFSPSELKRHRDNWFRKFAATDEPKESLRVSLSKLPKTRPELFGRDAELDILNNAWDNPQTNVLSIVAMGGQGKSALVNRWVHHAMAPEGYRGARKVYGWTFYSQGTKEDKQASSDAFIDAALRWFGAEMIEGESPWEKGRRLADLFRQERSLLVLDGLEPLQHPPAQGGKLRDPAVESLVGELAAHNPGLCVITTRHEVEDLNSYSKPQCVVINLEHLSPEAGARLLADRGVVNDDEKELRQASEDFGNHALALTLLGNYVATVYGGDIRQRDKIGSLLDEPKEGGHAKRVMKSYEEWYKSNTRPELSILRMMGLFDRPAPAGAIEVLRKPAIGGLTSALKSLSDVDWKYALANLRQAGLLDPANPAEPDTLDCHPLVREYFGDTLKRSKHSAWIEGHSRLFDYYCALPKKEFPDTFEEMMPLYAAIPHGCAAGRQQEAYHQIYVRRIKRADEAFSIRKLGAFGTDLAAISALFAEPWVRVADVFGTPEKARLNSLAGFCLRALGRTVEAVQPTEMGLDLLLADKDWKNAARASANLGEHYLAIGNIAKALDHSRQCVELADKEGNAFLRSANRTCLADALHQSGNYDASGKLFAEAEELQKQHQRKYQFLYSLQGYRYCDLLLSQSDCDQVIKRSRKMMEWRAPSDTLLTIGIDHLSLGRALLLESHLRGRTDFREAADHLNQASGGLRRAGVQEFIPSSVLACAELYRYQRDFAKARADLEEAERICTRCGLRLFEADCHLEYARFHLAQGEIDAARERLDKARVMIDEMGYHRRDRDVAEIDAELSNA
jgi:tetratricopeptide (TPR) repeat protein